MSDFYQAWYDFYPMYAAETGGKELVENGKATFNSPAGDAVAAFWQKLYAENLAGKEVYTNDPFAAGTVAMAIVGPWAIATYPKVDWGVVPVPTTTGSHGDQVPTFSDAKNIAMYASCKNRGTAWDFLKYSTSATEDGKLLDMTGQMPMRQGMQQLYASYFKANPAYTEFAAEAAHVLRCPTWRTRSRTGRSSAMRSPDRSSLARKAPTRRWPPPPRRSTSSSHPAQPPGDRRDMTSITSAGPRSPR